MSEKHVFPKFNLNEFASESYEWTQGLAHTLSWVSTNRRQQEEKGAGLHST